MSTTHAAAGPWLCCPHSFGQGNAEHGSQHYLWLATCRKPDALQLRHPTSTAPDTSTCTCRQTARAHPMHGQPDSAGGLRSTALMHTCTACFWKQCIRQVRKQQSNGPCWQPTAWRSQAGAAHASTHSLHNSLRHVAVPQDSRSGLALATANPTNPVNPPDQKPAPEQ